MSSTPVEDLASLATACERAQAEAMVELAREARPVADGWMTYGGPGAFLNKACGLGLSGAVPEGLAAAVLDFFESRQAEPRVEVSNFVHPSALQSLGRAGFQLQEFENVFLRPLGGAAVAVLPVPEGVQLERVDSADARAVAEYVRVSTSGFFPDGQDASEAFLDAALRAARLPGNDSFVARHEGRAVGAAGCASRHGTTNLFGASVLPDFRGQGIQTALILARLQRAWALGSTRATIVSHPGVATERNALHLGFRFAYVRCILVRPGATPSP